MILGSGDLRWVDDVFLLARTPRAFDFMISTLQTTLRGLRLQLVPQDPEKMSWAPNPNVPADEGVCCEESHIHVYPPTSGLPVLGRTMPMWEGPDTVALEAHIRAAWGQFRKHRPLLPSRSAAAAPNVWSPSHPVGMRDVVSESEHA